MSTSSLSEIKKELKNQPEERITELCLKLAKYKKENKELLHYLLFEADNEDNYIKNIKEDLVPEFATINRHNFYHAKKTIRKILRILKKHIKYSGIKSTEVELLIFFCQEIKATKIRLRDNKALLNIYDRQLILIDKVLGSLHEDLQYDYKLLISELAL